MECVVFSTHRQIRDYIAAHDNTILPKLYTMEEFLRRVIVVPGRVFVDEASRVLYLYRAIEKLDISKLGFERNFLSFVRNSEFVFRFFEELHAEQVTIERLKEVDLYADYEDHLTILEAIFERYKNLLEDENLVDRITVEEYRINENFLKGFERIDMHVDGYLSRFETDLLDRIGDPLYIHFVTTPFNEKLVERLGISQPLTMDRHYTLRWKRRECVDEEVLPKVRPETVEVAAFDERIDQVAFVLKQVDAFVESGADPDNIAVVLPDEEFAEYLKLFDPLQNFNYAMGTPFVQSRYYRQLSDLYDALSDRSESAKEKIEGSGIHEAFSAVNDFASFVVFLENLPTGPKELKTIDEAMYGFRQFAPLLSHASPLQMLHTWLQRLEPLSIDDVGGGKITVMGLLESRGKHFDGVVIVDFNEEVVPKVGEKDLFLNSLVRRHAGMPTRRDKENLQKNYYYRLLQNSDRIAISYLKNEEMMPSRFLMELRLPEAELAGDLYRSIISPDHPRLHRYSETVDGENPFVAYPDLSPTKLKDWLVCPLRFYYRYVEKIGKERDEQKAIGTLIHDALEAAAKNKTTFVSSKDYFGFLIDHLYRNTQDTMQRFELALTWEERLQRFCDDDFTRLVGSEQPVLEAWCEVEHNGYRLVSRIDRVDLTASTVRLIDYKTSKYIKTTLDDENDFQLLFYYLWAVSRYPNHRIETLYFNLYDVRVEVVDIEENLGRFDAILRDLNRESSVLFPKTDDPKMCRYCDFNVACGRNSL